MATRTERLAWLEVEAERIKERLDRLDRDLQGHPDAWLEIQLRMPPTVAEVMVDKLLSEARQQATTLATVVKTIEALSGEGEQEKPQSREDDLVQRRKDREAERAKKAAGQA